MHFNFWLIKIVYFFLNHINNRELNLKVKYVTFNHYNMSSNLIALRKFNIIHLIKNSVKQKYTQVNE